MYRGVLVDCLADLDEVGRLEDFRLDEILFHSVSFVKEGFLGKVEAVFVSLLHDYVIWAVVVASFLLRLLLL